MRVKRVIPTITVTAACALGAVPVASAAAPRGAQAIADVQQATSQNWSGYVAGGSSGHRFKSVTGSWTQPTASCSSSTGSTYGAFWVGLGGADNRQALEQDGTEVNCSATGRASYYAWYELVPSAPVKVDLAVHPGDRMSATTTVNGTSVTESIVNHTTGGSFSKTLTMANPDTSSAEWIAEAPSTCDQSTSSCTPLPLSDFGTVRFTSASATDTSGHTGPISDPQWSAAALTLSPGAGSMGYGGVDLSNAGGSGGATPSGLSANGSAFSVAYGGSGGGASGPTGASGASGGSGGSGGGAYGGGSPGSGYGGYPGGGGYSGYGVYPYPGGYIIVYPY